MQENDELDGLRAKLQHMGERLTQTEQELAEERQLRAAWERVAEGYAELHRLLFRMREVG